jgi:glycosyltransferase involved in cell wall biosynthesis
LAERILRILDNPGLRQQLEANARAGFHGGNFSIGRMVDSHMALYSRLLNGNERHPRN